MKLKEIRNQHNLTQAQVANDLGIPLRTYQNYERGVSEPGMDFMCHLADYYQTSTDVIMGHLASESERGMVAANEIDPLESAYHELNAAGRHLLVDYADTLCASGKYKNEDAFDESA